MPQSRTAQFKLLMLFIAFSLFTLLFNAYDSYLYDVCYDRCDSSWFFFCGRSWMNGLTPYADFSDCKGPLLWLIYGVASLINDHSHVGVYWICSIFYAFTFFYTYKIALLFLGNKRWAALCSVCMAAVFFFPLIHEGELRSEDFGATFSTVGLYIVCRMLYGGGSPSLRRDGFALGACFGATFLIKYNIAAAIGILFIFSWLWAYKQNPRMMWKLMLWQIIGFAVLVIPFVVYFAANGALPAFIRGYFLDAIETVAATNKPMYRSLITTFQPFITLVVLTLFVCACFAAKWLKTWRWFPLAAYLFFCLFTLSGAYMYYLISILIFYIFGLIGIAKYLSPKLPHLNRITLFVCAFLVPTSTFIAKTYMRGGGMPCFSTI